MNAPTNLIGSEVDIEVAGKTYPGYVECEKTDGLSVILYHDKDKKFKVFTPEEIAELRVERECPEGYNAIEFISPENDEVITSMRFTDTEYSYFEAGAKMANETLEEFIIASLKTALIAMEEKIRADGKS